MLDLYFENFKPVSSNAMYNAFRGSINKSAKYKQFEKFISQSMSCKIRQVREFEKSFDRAINSLSCRVVIEIPETDYFTKDKFIPKKLNDLDNFLKCQIDSVFKSFSLLDDSYITEIVAVKIISKDGNYNARFQLRKESLY